MKRKVNDGGTRGHAAPTIERRRKTQKSATADSPMRTSEEERPTSGLDLNEAPHGFDLNAPLEDDDEEFPEDQGLWVPDEELPNFPRSSKAGNWSELRDGQGGEENETQALEEGRAIQHAVDVKDGKPGAEADRRRVRELQKSSLLGFDNVGEKGTDGPPQVSHGKYDAHASGGQGDFQNKELHGEIRREDVGGQQIVEDPSEHGQRDDAEGSGRSSDDEKGQDKTGKKALRGEVEGKRKLKDTKQLALEMTRIEEGILSLRKPLGSPSTLGITPDLDIISSVWEAHAQWDMSSIDRTLCQALRECGRNMAHPSRYHYLSCVYISKKFPEAFSLPETFKVLVEFIMPTPEPLHQGAKRPAILPVFACRLLLRAFDHLPQWPLEFVTAYLHDVCGPRTWVDNESCRDFVASILTAFPHTGMDHVRDDSSVARGVEAAGGGGLSGSTPGSSSLPPLQSPGSDVRKRYSDESLREAVREEFRSVLDSLLGHAAAKDNPRQLLKLLMLGAGYEEVRVVASSMLESWLSSPLHLRLVRPLLERILVLTHGTTENDYHTIANLLTLKIKGPQGSTMFGEVVTQVARRCPEYASLALKTFLLAEVQKPSGHNMRAIATVLRAMPHSPPPEEQLALIFQELATNEETRPHIRGLLKRLIRGSAGDVSASPFCRGLLTPWPAMAQQPQPLKEAWLFQLVDLICLLLPLGAAQLVGEDSTLPSGTVNATAAPSAQTASSSNKQTQLQQFRFDAATIQMEAMAWCTDVLAVYLPNLTLAQFKFAVRRLLFLQPDTMEKKPDGADEWEQTGSRLLSLGLPVYEETLARIILMGISQDYPLSPEEAMSILESLVLRAAALNRELPESLLAENHQLPAAIFKLSALLPPRRISTELPALAVVPLYWKASILVMLIAVMNCPTIGRFAWENFPSVHRLLEGLLKATIPYLPTNEESLHDGDPERQSEEVVMAFQEAVAEEDRLLAEEAMVEAASRGLPPPSQLPTVFPGGGIGELKLMVLDHDSCMQPPAWVWEEVKGLDADLKLGQLLRASRKPNFLQEVTRNQGVKEAWPWLRRVLQSEPAVLRTLPPVWQCELLFLHESGARTMALPPDETQRLRNDLRVVVTGTGLLESERDEDEGEVDDGQEAGGAAPEVDPAAALLQRGESKRQRQIGAAKAVVGFLASKLASRQNMVRQQAHRCLSHILGPPSPSTQSSNRQPSASTAAEEDVGASHGEGLEVVRAEGQERIDGSWVEALEKILWKKELVDVLLPAVRAALSWETSIPMIAAFIFFLQRNAPILPRHESITHTAAVLLLNRKLLALDLLTPVKELACYAHFPWDTLTPSGKSSWTIRNEVAAILLGALCAVLDDHPTVPIAEEQIPVDDGNEAHQLVILQSSNSSTPKKVLRVVVEGAIEALCILAAVMRDCTAGEGEKPVSPAMYDLYMRLRDSIFPRIDSANIDEETWGKRKMVQLTEPKSGVPAMDALRQESALRLVKGADRGLRWAGILHLPTEVLLSLLQERILSAEAACDLLLRLDELPEERFAEVFEGSSDAGGALEGLMRSVELLQGEGCLYGHLFLSRLRFYRSRLSAMQTDSQGASYEVKQTKDSSVRIEDNEMEQLEEVKRSKSTISLEEVELERTADHVFRWLLLPMAGDADLQASQRAYWQVRFMLSKKSEAESLLETWQQTHACVTALQLALAEAGSNLSLKGRARALLLPLLTALSTRLHSHWVQAAGEPQTDAHVQLHGRASDLTSMFLKLIERLCMNSEIESNLEGKAVVERAQEGLALKRGWAKNEGVWFQKVLMDHTKPLSRLSHLQKINNEGVLSRDQMSLTGTLDGQSSKPDGAEVGGEGIQVGVKCEHTEEEDAVMVDADNADKQQLEHNNGRCDDRGSLTASLELKDVLMAPACSLQTNLLRFVSGMLDGGRHVNGTLKGTAIAAGADTGAAVACLTCLFQDLLMAFVDACGADGSGREGLTSRNGVVVRRGALRAGENVTSDATEMSGSSEDLFAKCVLMLEAILALDPEVREPMFEGLVVKSLRWWWSLSSKETCRNASGKEDNKNSSLDVKNTGAGKRKHEGEEEYEMPRARNAGLPGELLSVVCAHLLQYGSWEALDRLTTSFLQVVGDITVEGGPKLETHEGKLKAPAYAVSQIGGVAGAIIDFIDASMTHPRGRLPRLSSAVDVVENVPAFRCTANAVRGLTTLAAIELASLSFCSCKATLGGSSKQRQTERAGRLHGALIRAQSGCRGAAGTMAKQLYLTARACDNGSLSIAGLHTWDRAMAEACRTLLKGLYFCFPVTVSGCLGRDRFDDWGGNLDFEEAIFGLHQGSNSLTHALSAAVVSVCSEDEKDSQAASEFFRCFAQQHPALATPHLLPLAARLQEQLLSMRDANPSVRMVTVRMFSAAFALVTSMRAYLLHAYTSAAHKQQEGQLSTISQRALEAIIDAFCNLLTALGPQDRAQFTKLVGQLAELVWFFAAAGGKGFSLISRYRTRGLEGAAKVFPRVKKLRLLLTELEKADGRPSEMGIQMDVQPLPMEEVHNVRRRLQTLIRLSSETKAESLHFPVRAARPALLREVEDEDEGAEECIDETVELLDLLADIERASAQMPALLSFLEEPLQLLAGAANLRVRNCAYVLLHRLLGHCSLSEQSLLAIGQQLLEQLRSKEWVERKAAAQEAVLLLHHLPDHSEALLFEMFRIGPPACEVQQLVHRFAAITKPS